MQKLEAFSRPLLKRTLPRTAFEKTTFFLRLGYWPDLLCPRSVNEKISYMKMHDLPANVKNLVDKLEVRNFVRAKIGEKYLTTIGNVFESPEEIDLTFLPDAFALKCNVGSGTNTIVHNKSDVVIEDLVKASRAWIAKPFSEQSNTYESIYDGIRPKLFVEALLTPVETLQEYKIWCFHGEPALIQVSSMIEGEERFKFYDLEWKDCGFNVYHKNTRFIVERPFCFNALIELAKKLSENFHFVRVDLNVSEDFGITFGELTFHPGGGRLRFFPAQYDFILGEQFPLR